MNHEDEAPDAPEPAVAPAPAQWERKTRFAINDKMADVVRKTRDATLQEIAARRRQIEKMTYGS